MTAMAPALVRAEKLKTVHAVTVRARAVSDPRLHCLWSDAVSRRCVQSAKEQARRLSMPAETCGRSGKDS